MPSILSRFRRSPSRSSQDDADDNEDHRHRRESSASSHRSVPRDHDAPASPSAARSPQSQLTRSGSAFVEDLGKRTDVQDGASPSKARFITPNGSSRAPPPAPLSVPESGLKPALGTPKLVLTEEGSNSPHSFTSDRLGSSPTPASRTSGLGLGDIGSSTSTSTSEDNAETPTVDGHFAMTSNGQDGLHAKISPDDPRRRSGSITSANGTRDGRSGSIVSRIAGRPGSPATAHAILEPSKSRRSSISRKEKKKEKKSKKKKERSKSTSSGISGHHSIAAALAKSGLHIASPTDSDLPASAQTTSSRSKSSNRSPWLVRGKDAGDDDSFVQGEDDGVYMDDDDIDDEEDDTDSDLDEHLPVTGFAVASNRRQAEFHAQFPSVDEGDYLIEDYGCALSKDILVQGRLYVSENHLCFHANIFGWVTDLVIPFTDIRTIDKKMTALVIPNAIGVSTGDSKYTFASLISRDSTYDVMMNIWRLCNPNAVMSTTSFAPNGHSRPASVVDETVGSATTAETTGKSPTKGHAKTQCQCGKDGKHYSETAMDAIFHSTPEKIHDLMFNSEWFKTFLSENQKLKDVEISDWKPSPETKNESRSISYIKPLNGSIGPKQTKCNITDEQEHKDYDQYISMLTTTRTPDVPSGGVFSVKTKSCFMWAGPNSTKVIVTTTVEWTGKSWVKGIIEKSAIDGQKTYHTDLENGMKEYIKAHAADFAGAEGIPDEDEATEGAEGGDLAKPVSTPTEAAAYAAEQRKRQEQGTFGTLTSSLSSAFDMLGDGGVGKNALGLVIFFLVLSNVYTYYAYRPTGEGMEVRRAKRMGGRGGGAGGGLGTMENRDVEEAVRMILREQATPLEQAKELRRTLDEVERKARELRELLGGVPTGEKTKNTLNDLD